MRTNAETFDVLERALPLMRRFPDVYLDINFSGANLAIQAQTQAEVRAIRAVMPGAIWKKSRSNCGWWEYHTVYEGLSVFIYSCREAPPTCRAIEEEYAVVEKVPVEFTLREVTKTRIRWECEEGVDD